MRYDARTQTWISMEIKGVQGYFNDMRIDRETVPGWFTVWELADGSSDGEPCRYRRGILVDFFGTFITTGDLPVDDTLWKEGYIRSRREWAFTGEKYLPFAEVMRREMVKMLVSGKEKGNGISGI